MAKSKRENSILTDRQTDRQAGLDLFRIFLAILTLAFHTSMHLGCNYGILDGVAQMGAVAMTGFFMLSGFANFISTENREFDIKKFYMKRAISVLPLYYFTALIFIIFRGNENVVENIILFPMEILCLQIVYPNTFGLTHNGGTWFVSGIVICYFLFPLIRKLILDMQYKKRLVLLMCLMIVLLYSPILEWKFQLGGIYSNPFIRLVEFSVGMLIASLQRDYKKYHFLTNPFLIVVEFACLLLGIEGAWYFDIGRGNYMLYTWIVLPCFTMMLMSLSLLKIHDNTVIRYMSSVSYSFFMAQFYLWPIMYFLVGKMKSCNNMMKIALSFLICLLISIVMHEVVEKPLKKILLNVVGR